MKNKAPLSLMEQLCMLLVFALSAALCVQIYVLSDRISRYCETRGQAVTLVQNTAEKVKFCKGDADRYPELLGGEGNDEKWQLGYDENWEKVPLEQACYRLVVASEDTGMASLGRSTVSAFSEKDGELFSVTVSWQEAAYE